MWVQIYTRGKPFNEYKNSRSNGLCPGRGSATCNVIDKQLRRMTNAYVDVVFPLDTKQTKSIIAIKTKPPFKPVFQVAVSRKGSRISIFNEPLNGSSVFLVETGEGRVPLETRYIINWLSQFFPASTFS